MGFVDNIRTMYQLAKEHNNIKGSRTEPLFQLVTYDDVVATNWGNYATLVNEGYKRNSVVFACISGIAREAAKAKWHVYRKNEDGTRKIARNHPLNKLLIQANPMQSFSQWIEEGIIIKLIGGNAYWEAKTTGLGRDNYNIAPSELHNLRPDRMKLLVNGSGVYGYVYDISGGSNSTWTPALQQMFESASNGGFETIETKRYNPSASEILWLVNSVNKRSNIFHDKIFDPMNDFYGTGLVQVAGDYIDVYNFFVTWNKNLMKNGAKLDGILMAKGRIGEEGKRDMRAQIETFRGLIGSNAGKFLILEDDIRWQQIGLSPKDVDFLDGKNSVAVDICNVIDYPHQLIVASNDTFANVKESGMHLWGNTIIGHLDDRKSKLNSWLGSRFDDFDDHEVDYDVSHVEAMANRWAKTVETVNKAKNILTLNEQRGRLKYPPIKGGDVVFIPKTQIPLKNQLMAEGDVLSESDSNDSNEDTQ